MRNREIAKQLGVTEGTVKVYLHRVFEKVGVKNRTELAIRADEFLAASYLAAMTGGRRLQPAMRLEARPTTIWLARS